jgi:SAM-dependent methyltransferase
MSTKPDSKEKTSNDPNWYEGWFDSPYYHLLYRNRNFQEAELFIRNLIERLDIKMESKILDVACGRGRHSIYLNRLGMQVDGIDLSDESIRHALQFENEGLHFYKHDMRHPFRIEAYDVVVNLFTSFGYFERRTEHVEAIAALRENLKPDGIFIIDYLNAHKVSNTLPVKEELDREGVVFQIHKFLDDKSIVKDIQFNSEGKDFHYRETVKGFTRDDFESFFEQVGFETINVFGDYHLNDFDLENSDRLILVAKKITG